MKKIILAFLIIFNSCTITKSIPINYKTNSELSEFYKNHNVEEYYIVNSYKSLVELYKQDRVSIPKNLIFDNNGLEIEHFNDKLCVNHTLEFLRNYNEKTKIKNSNFKIDDYLKYFKTPNNSVKIDEILNSKKIRIFVNTATYAEKYKANEEAFEIYKEFKDKYDVYLINLDYIDDWDDK